MAQDSVEIELTEGAVAELRDWASLWADLLYVDMALHARDNMADDAAHLFARRALWEAAVIAYGRVFGSGRRKLAIKHLVEEMGDEAKRCHGEILSWRNQHAAHRVAQERERVDVRAVIDPRKGTTERVAVTVSPTAGPEEEGDWLPRFRAHVKELRDKLWSTYSGPLEDQILREHDPENLLTTGKVYSPPSDASSSP